MLIKIFIIFSLILILSILLFKLIISKSKDNIKSSSFVAIIAIFLALYILMACIIALFKNDLIMGLFAISPFIIGKLATWEKEKIYTIIQILTIMASIIYAIYVI